MTAVLYPSLCLTALILCCFIPAWSQLDQLKYFRKRLCQQQGDMSQCQVECPDGFARPKGCEICMCRDSLCHAVSCPAGFHCAVQTQENEWIAVDTSVCLSDYELQKASLTPVSLTTVSDTMPLAAATTSTNADTTSETPTATTGQQTRAELSIAVGSTTISTTMPTATSTITSTTSETPTTTTIAPSTAATSTSVSSAAAAASSTSETPTTTTVAPTTAATSTTTVSVSSATTSNLGEKQISGICEQRGRCDNTGVCEDPAFVCRRDGRCCKSDRPLPDTDVPRCQQKPSSGMCRAYTNQFVYDIDIGRCTETVHGGCGLSGNSFETMEECKDTCEKPCEQPQSDGPCRANIPRYYFDLTVNECRIFDYGGCLGNSNNFLTKESCDMQCRGLGRREAISIYSPNYRANSDKIATSSEGDGKVASPTLTTKEVLTQNQEHVNSSSAFLSDLIYRHFASRPSTLVFNPHLPNGSRKSSTTETIFAGISSVKEDEDKEEETITATTTATTSTTTTVKRPGLIDLLMRFYHRRN